jgi:hypothetical protein
MRTLDRFPTTARTITEKEVVSARQASVWYLGNQTLYNLCRKHPRHTKADEIIAKVWLIGRSYAASIERRRNADKFGDAFYEKTVAPIMKDSGIDEWLASLSNDKSIGSPNTLVIHKKLMDLFASITGLEKRSLASKYLHFHKPNAFFIYDSRARQAITKITPRRNGLPEIPAADYDPEYKTFVRRCVWLRREIYSNHGVVMKPREIDQLLLAKTGKGSFTGVTIGR